MSRKQCAMCPWKADTNPHEIPDGYCATKHAGPQSTIAEPGALGTGALHLMACHETGAGAELPCVGWLVHQLNEGNNIGLRLGVMSRRIDADVETVGPQHATFEATLPGGTE